MTQSSALRSPFSISPFSLTFCAIGSWTIGLCGHRRMVGGMKRCPDGWSLVSGSCVIIINECHVKIFCGGQQHSINSSQFIIIPAPPGFSVSVSVFVNLSSSRFHFVPVLVGISSAVLSRAKCLVALNQLCGFLLAA